MKSKKVYFVGADVIAALLLTGINWLISQRLDTIYKRLDKLESLINNLSHQIQKYKFHYTTLKRHK